MLALRKERERRGWTLDKLSKKTAISQPDLSRLERGLCPAYPGWKKKIALAFRVKLADADGVLFREVEDDE